MAGSALGPVAVAVTTAAQAVMPDGWSTTLGLALSQGSSGLVRIGGDDPDSPDEIPFASDQQSWEDVGLQGLRNEEGDIICSARGFYGATDLVAAVNDVQSVLDLIAATLRLPDPTLGIPQLLWTQFGTQVDWFQGIDPDYGLKVRAVFTVHFRALI